MPIEDLVHVGVALVVDQQGVALKCRWTVYVGSVDVFEQSLDVGQEALVASEAATAAHREAIRWLEVQAATKRPPTPSVPLVDDAVDVPTPDSGDSSRSTGGREPRRRRGQSGPRRAVARVLASTSLDVEDIVDPPRSDLLQGPVTLAENAPPDVGGEAGQRRRRSGQRGAARGADPGEGAGLIDLVGAERSDEDTPPVPRPRRRGVEREGDG